MVLRSEGFGILWAAGMIIFMYAGSLQYVGIDLLASSASVMTVALTSLFVNVRHVFYSLSMLDKYKDTKHKGIVAFLLTEKTYSLVCQKEHSEDYYLLVSLLNDGYWITGSILGNVFGGILPIRSEGIDFALTALFLTVIVEQGLRTKNHIPALIGVFSSIACLFIFGKDMYLLPTMFLISILLMMKRGVLDA